LRRQGEWGEIRQNILQMKKSEEDENIYFYLVMKKYSFINYVMR
jgi:hypothetical protein